MAPSSEPVDKPRHAADLPPALLEAEVARIAGSQAFRRSPQHVRLLHYLIEHTLAGTTNELREIVIGVEVFGRSASGFDPRRDAIVRVQACRLREKLARYYESEGADAPLEIRLPVGGYQPTFRRRDAPRAVAVLAASLAAKDLVERGYHFLRQGGEKNLLDAIKRFEAALQEDPDYAPAHLGIARGWINLVGETHRHTMPWIDYAAEALQRSLQLEPDHPEALTLLGSLLHRYDYDWDAALPRFQRALELAPDRAFVHSTYGFHLLLAGQLAEAEIELKAARRLDAQYLNSRWHMVYLRIAQRRWADAEKELVALMDLTPSDFRVLGLAGVLSLYSGRPGEALARFNEVEAAAPQQSIGLVGIAQARLLLGDERAAAEALEQLHARFAASAVSPYQMALVEMRRHRSAAALRLLEEAALLRDSNVIFAPTEPTFEPLRGDIRFDTLLVRHRRAAGLMGEAVDPTKL